MDTLNLLDLAAHEVENRINSKLYKMGLSIIKVRFLKYLVEHEEGEVILSDVARVTQRARHDITTLGKRMMRANLIGTKINPADKRSSIVYITPEGRQVYNRAEKIVQDFTAQTLKSLGIRELNRFHRVLVTIQNNSSRNNSEHNQRGLRKGAKTG